MRVYPWPYGYTANNQPLYLQYGAGGAEIAARTICGLGNGYGHCGDYGGEAQDGYYNYGHGGQITGGYYGTEGFRYGIREGEGGAMADSGEEHGGMSRVDGEVQREIDARGADNGRQQKLDVGSGRTSGGAWDSMETEDDEILANKNDEKEGERKRQMDEMDAACTLERLRENKEGEKGEEKVEGQGGVCGEMDGVQVPNKGTGRISWTAELHGAFLRAVDELGVERAVPMSILRRMGVEGLTREQVASHLQKHRTTLKREQESREREILLSVAARSVMRREEGLEKRMLTAEEVLEAVAKQEKMNGETEEDGKNSGGVKGGVGKVGSGKRSETRKLKDLFGKSRRQRKSIPRHM